MLVLGESLLHFSRSNATESHGGCSRDVVSGTGTVTATDVNITGTLAAGTLNIGNQSITNFTVTGNLTLSNLSTPTQSKTNSLSLKDQSTDETINTDTS